MCLVNLNQAITPENFAHLHELALEYLRGKKDLFRFDGFAGADPKFRLKVSVITEEAWHSLFAKTLFINSKSPTNANAKKPSACRTSTPANAGFKFKNAKPKRPRSAARLKCHKQSKTGLRPCSSTPGASTARCRRRRR